MIIRQWFKWRKNYSSGPSSWKYDKICHDSETPLSEEYIEEYIEEEFVNSWIEGEHYRGFDFELVDKPPMEYIDTRIEYYLNRIKYAEQSLVYLHSLKNESKEN